MAHPDDAEILCGGTLARLSDLGWEMHIATMTAGDCGSLTMPAGDTGELRKAEAARSAALIKAQYHALDEHDGFVVYDRPTLRKVVDLMRKISPSVVITHAQRDHAMDHEQTSQLARGASLVFPAPNASQVPGAAGSRVPHLYFADPVDGVEPSGATVEPTTVIRIAKEYSRKIEMITCHASQAVWRREHHRLGDVVEAVERLAIDRGRLIGATLGEAFVQFIGHGYPSDDLLRNLLSGNASGADTDGHVRRVRQHRF